LSTAWVLPDWKVLLVVGPEVLAKPVETAPTVPLM
jgi:hypothetical protein